MNEVLKIDNISFSYSSVPIFQNVSLSVQENDILIILGPNGVGKSTLLKCALGLLKHQGGSIQYLGKSIQDFSKTELAKIVCLVPQLSAISTSFLARDYIAIACTPYLKFYETPSREVYEKIDALAMDFNASSLLNRPMSQLSGGEQQIISIIKALAQDTPIIILDEPTSALDYGNQGKFLQYVKKLKSLGKTIIMTSHNPNHALILDSKVCALQGNTVKYCGDAKDVITEQMLNDIYNGSFQLIQNGDGTFSANWSLK